jgi:GntR family transcriptional repressor for pyruvate dehydrogenase complex
MVTQRKLGVTADMSADPKGRTIRRRSNAELIADNLRRSIVQGEMGEGSALPALEQLRKQFGVGLPAVREAIRILESENLVTVVRGNTGGAIVHAPRLSGAASRLGMVLQSQRVELGDLAAALRAIEPVCAQLCAEKRDDNTVGMLAGLIEETRAATDDEQTAIMLNRRFHETLAEQCGNQTLRALVGALEFLWSGQEQHWARNLPSRYTMENRLAGIAAHERILDKIRAGDGAGAYLSMSEHIAEGYTYAVPDPGVAIELRHT